MHLRLPPQRLLKLIQEQVPVQGQVLQVRLVHHSSQEQAARLPAVTACPPPLFHSVRTHPYSALRHQRVKQRHPALRALEVPVLALAGPERVPPPWGQELEALAQELFVAQG